MLLLIGLNHSTTQYFSSGFQQLYHSVLWGGWKPGWCFAILPPVNEAFCCHSDDSSCSSAVLIITLSAFKGSVMSRVANEGAGTLTMILRWDKPPARITGDTPTAGPIRSQTDNLRRQKKEGCVRERRVCRTFSWVNLLKIDTFPLQMFSCSSIN